MPTRLFWTVTSCFRSLFSASHALQINLRWRNVFAKRHCSMLRKTLSENTADVLPGGYQIWKSDGTQAYHQLHFCFHSDWNHCLSLAFSDVFDNTDYKEVYLSVLGVCLPLTKSKRLDTSVKDNADMRYLPSSNCPKGLWFCKPMIQWVRYAAAC